MRLGSLHRDLKRRTTYDDPTTVQVSCSNSGRHDTDRRTSRSPRAGFSSHAHVVATEAPLGEARVAGRLINTAATIAYLMLTGYALHAKEPVRCYRSIGCLRPTITAQRGQGGMAQRWGGAGCQDAGLSKDPGIRYVTPACVRGRVRDALAKLRGPARAWDPSLA